MTTASKTWVVKIGSSLLTKNGQGLAVEAIADWADQCAALRKQGINVVIVSSGAVAAGMATLGWDARPQLMHQVQAAAAVGQRSLVEAWQRCFDKHKVTTAQVLLTHDDVANNERYQNARATLKELISLGVVPVVNENDTVAVEELRLGDNDSLGALVVELVGAERLVILTDQQGLFTADPRYNKDAQLIAEIAVNDPTVLEMAGEGAGALGRGGMRTKVLAARRAAQSGADTVIAAGVDKAVVQRIAEGEALGTRLY